MRVHTLTTELWFPRSLEEVFSFFSDAGNLETLTPPYLHFKIRTPAPIPMGPGTLIDYTIRWRGFPMEWRTEIAAWEPPFRFVDRQIKGPYRQWVHEHTFEAKDAGTLMRDRVDYAVPGWIFEPLVARWIVTPDVESIFAYRRKRMLELFGTPLSTSADAQ